MKGSGINLGPRPRYLGLIALLTVGAVLLILVAGGTDESVAGAVKGAGRAKPEVVGKVTSVAGNTDGITVKPKGGREHPLRQGDQLHLDDVIDPDAGVEATLSLTIPAGVSENRELVFVDPGKGDQHTVTLERTGKRASEVVIGD